LLDRIDIHIEVPRVDYEKLSGDRMGESSASICARVQAARDIQNKRFLKNSSSDIICNADMRVGEIRQFCKFHDEEQSLMWAAMNAVQFVGKSLSSHAKRETRAHDCGISSERRDPIHAPGRGAAVSTQVDDRLTG
jgi:magnesium chelatase family protein